MSDITQIPNIPLDDNGQERKMSAILHGLPRKAQLKLITSWQAMRGRFLFVRQWRSTPMAKESQPASVGVVLTIGTVVIVCTIVCGCLWLRPPTVFDFPDGRLSYKTGGPDFTVTFLAQDTKGRPIEGVRVASESYSGWTQYATTDHAGRAVVKPAEIEVIALEVDGRIVSFKVETRIEKEFFLPDCAEGMIVNVELVAKNAHPPPFR